MPFVHCIAQCLHCQKKIPVIISSLHSFGPKMLAPLRSDQRLAIIRDTYLKYYTCSWYTKCMTYCGNYHENLLRSGFTTVRETTTNGKKNISRTGKSHICLVFAKSCPSEPPTIRHEREIERKTEIFAAFAADQSVGDSVDNGTVSAHIDKLNNRLALYIKFIFLPRASRQKYCSHTAYGIYY